MIIAGLLAIHQSNAASLNVAAEAAGPTVEGHGTGGTAGGETGPVGPEPPSGSGPAPNETPQGNGQPSSKDTTTTTTAKPTTTVTVTTETTKSTVTVPTVSEATITTPKSPKPTTTKPASEATQATEGGVVTDNKTDAAGKPGQTDAVAESTAAGQTGSDAANGSEHPEENATTSGVSGKYLCVALLALCAQQFVL